MSLLIVNNKMPKPVAFTTQLPARAGAPPVKQARLLKPGSNEVDADEFEAATKKSPVWKHWRDKGDVVIEATVKEDSGLSELAPEKAAHVVKETFDLELLGKWFDHEERPKVKEALRKRRQFLEEQIEKAKKDNAA